MVNSGNLIQDVMPLKILRRDRVMSEGVDGKKRPVLRVGGQFQYANRPNANGRIYPTVVLEDAVKRLQEDIKQRRVLGEFDHPPDAKIHLDRVSHLITKLWMEGDVVYGEAEVLENTIMGSQLKALLESGVNVGISSRGVGDMETTIHEGEEYYKVLDGYSFVTFDMVAEPSVQGSFMSVLESKNRDAIRQVKNRRKQAEKNLIEEIKRQLR